MIHDIRKIRLFCFGVLALVLTLPGGCTQNNGHLGPLFGSWALVEITQDGEPLDLGDETVFGFQNEIVNVVRYIDPPYTITTRYGNFSHAGDELTLKFQTEPTATGNRSYMAPEWLHFPKDENILHFEVRKLTGSEMALSIQADGATMEYRFRKTW